MFPEKMEESWQWSDWKTTPLPSPTFDFSLGVFHQPPQTECVSEQMTRTGSLSFYISLADSYGKWPLEYFILSGNSGLA